MQEEARLREAINEIINFFAPRLPKRPRYNPFEILVATIISQNTNDLNTFRAMAELRRYGITPKGLASANVRDIAKMIRVAGLQRQKAERIREVSRFICRKYRGNVKELLKMPDDVIREELMSVEGIGPKTADVFLAFAKGSEVVPVDTHIFRISKRLGAVDSNGTYEEVQRKLHNLIARELRISGHLALIQFGREICRARNPRCMSCMVRWLCPASTCRV